MSDCECCPDCNDCKHLMVGINFCKKKSKIVDTWEDGDDCKFFKCKHHTA